MAQAIQLGAEGASRAVIEHATTGAKNKEVSYNSDPLYLELIYKNVAGGFVHFASNERLASFADGNSGAELIGVENDSFAVLSGDTDLQATIKEIDTVLNAISIPDTSNLFLLDGTRDITGNTTISKSAPTLYLEDTGGATNDKVMQIFVDNGQLEINSLNDNLTSRLDDILRIDMGSGEIFAGYDMDVGGQITSNSGGGSGSPSFLASSSSPSYEWNETDVALDTKNWDLIANAGILSLRALNDAYSATSTIWSVNRTGVTPGTFSLNPLLLANGGVEFGFGVDSVSRIFRSSVSGLKSRGVTGSSYDWSVFSPSNVAILYNLTGTNDFQFTGNIILNGALFGHQDNSSTNISGGIASTSGANTIWYGPTHATAAGEIWMRNGSGLNAYWDATGNFFQNYDMDISGDLDMGGDIHTAGNLINYSGSTYGLHFNSDHTTYFEIPDSENQAFRIEQGINNYFTIDTDVELVIIGNLTTNPNVIIYSTGLFNVGGTSQFDGSVDMLSTLDVTGPVTFDSTLTFSGDAYINIQDGSATAFQIREGSNNYLLIETANAAERMTFGNALNPDFLFVGNGTVYFSADIDVTGDILAEDIHLGGSIGEFGSGLSFTSDVATFANDVNVLIGGLYTSDLRPTGTIIFGGDSELNLAAGATSAANANSSRDNIGSDSYIVLTPTSGNDFYGFTGENSRQQFVMVNRSSSITALIVATGSSSVLTQISPGESKWFVYDNGSLKTEHSHYSP